MKPVNSRGYKMAQRRFKKGLPRPIYVPGLYLPRPFYTPNPALINLSVSVCLSVCMSVSLSLFVSDCLSLSLSV